MIAFLFRRRIGKSDKPDAGYVLEQRTSNVTFTRKSKEHFALFLQAPFVKDKNEKNVTL